MGQDGSVNQHRAHWKTCGDHIIKDAQYFVVGRGFVSAKRTLEIRGRFETAPTVDEIQCKGLRVGKGLVVQNAKDRKYAGCWIFQ